MITTATMKWMVETVIDGISVIYRWLVPYNKINAATVCAGCPVGPEFMLWDSILNADVKRSYNYHFVVPV